MPSHSVGGAEFYARDLAREQAKRGHLVVIAGRGEGSAEAPEGSGLTYRMIGHPVTSETYHSEYKSVLRYGLHKASVQFDLPVAFRIGRIVRRFRPDIVHTHSLSALTPLVWGIASSPDAALVHTLHDFASICSNGALLHDGAICAGTRRRCTSIRTLHRTLGARVSGVSAVGEDVLRRHLAAGFFANVPESRRKVIWNPVTAPVPGRQRRQSSSVRFGFLGRLEQAKGVDLLIAAARTLPTAGWSLTLAGRAPAGLDRYRAMADGLPIAFLGHVDADEFFAQIDCLIAPSVWPEAFGRTVAEALLRGVPVIGSDTAGIAEQLRNWGSGWLFPAGDRAVLAEIMGEIVARRRALTPVPPRPDLEKRMAPQTTAELTSDLYSAVLADRTTGMRGST